MGATNFECNVEELYRWIDGYSFSRQKRNISRDFSDAIPLAEILKHHYPKLVELHNYTPKNSMTQKLINWQTLNRKVLSKLELTLTNDVMQELAHSVPGAIEKLLVSVKERVERVAEKQQHHHNISCIEGLSGSIIPIRQRNSTKMVDHKVIPVDSFQSMEQQLEEKSEIINGLTQKVQHLESLLDIKDERINDLTKQIQQISGNRSSSSLPIIKGGGSTFFSKLF
ncbi:hypothetical protein PPYR_12403 [Photinus pyralis]|uniref:Calponin-homology (CH) domain-containing protein n=1 Tax=Photinus pyralis TaxID=7054 RepID=A0A1Y1KPI8_PHOPY|nr:hypothetical protein PPYR_12403 [Photinus pyralis]